MPPHGRPSPVNDKASDPPPSGALSFYWALKVLPCRGSCHGSRGGVAVPFLPWQARREPDLPESRARMPQNRRERLTPCVDTSRLRKRLRRALRGQPAEPCLHPVSAWLVGEIVALAVARKMDDDATARPSRRFPASSDLAFSIELEMDAVSTLLDPCLHTAWGAFANGIPIADTPAEPSFKDLQAQRAVFVPTRYHPDGAACQCGTSSKYHNRGRSGQDSRL